MSGSDSGGPPSGPTGTSPCDQLRLIRNLEAPVVGIADHLVVGDQLGVALREGQPPLVVATDPAGQEAGGILPTGQLIECLRAGFDFVAEVTSANGGAIRLRVQPAT
jgi:hypothetical protein